MIKKLIFTALTVFTGLAGFSQSFKVVPLGVLGGSHEDNLSAYMVTPAGQNQYVCLDAGTLYAGIQKAIDKHSFSGDAEEILRDSIKGYLISHGHLDHLSGLILNSPDDSPKPIYAMPYVIDVFKKHYFSWDTWANFADQGEKPALSKYHYVGLAEGKEISLANTKMLVTPFSLSHGKPYQSTAFLLRYHQNYLLYLGDTGADRIEQSQKLDSLWQAVAPLIKKHQLKVIMMEVSFPNAQPERQLFGHLTPNLFMEEMKQLSKYVGADAMKNLNVAITHMKPAGNHLQEIKNEVLNSNILGLNLVFPKQGEKLIF